MEPRHNTDLGQHFLREPRIARRIVEVADIAPGMRILEVGPGSGVLTVPLAEAVGPDGEVVAVEADARFASRLDVPHVTVHHADAMQADLAAWGPYDRIVSNLPYQISGPITFRFLDLLTTHPWGRAVLMFQKEFADRLLAGPGSKQYGRLSVHVARACAVSRVRDVPPGCFDPPPKVQSTIVCLDPYTEPLFHVADERVWRAVVDGAFNQRRKQLKNTVPPAVAGFGIDAASALRALEDEDLLMERPEQVAPVRFAALVSRLVA